MIVKLVEIGSSLGVELPRDVVARCGFGEEIEMHVTGGTIVLGPRRGPREGWDEAFAKAATDGEDAPAASGSGAYDWDESEWEW
ncbi:AbrB/MazE/SpoVT family DNA-binding domain-containing protein [Salinarimonas sp.]|uniref:AbrB/MazE/SpoVT family DNA-binding domain-containing protein n=1 Tax=Salinarimonas sp. TaxID=2766526 RepID=UPI0032D945C7